MIIPYLGIKGFTVASQVRVLAPLFNRIRHRQLMVGVTVHQEMLEARTGPRKHPTPTIETVSDLFQASSINCLNLVHYHTKQPSTLERQLTLLTDMIGDRLEGFQLDLPWPDPDVIRSCAQSGLTIALRIGPDALQAIKHQPRELASRIKRRYGNSVTYIVLDLAEKDGVLNPDPLIPFLETLQQKHGTRYNMVVTGPLEADNLQALAPLVRIAPSLSLCSEGTLLDPTTHQLDLERAAAYLRKGAELFKE